MWHESLENDLKEIFKMPKVLFGSPQLFKEQDILFCDIESVKNNKISRGIEYARVYGKVSIKGLLDKNKSGYLSKQIQLAKIELTNKFVFQREEQPIIMGNYEERFNCYSIEFLYFYKEEYNPQRYKLESKNITYRIISFIKGVFK